MNTKSKNITLSPANLSVPDGAQWLGIGQTKMWALIRDGEIQAVRLGSRTLLPLAELQRFQSQLVNGAAA
jgi:excisionase family DNA binding protein